MKNMSIFFVILMFIFIFNCNHLDKKSHEKSLEKQNKSIAKINYRKDVLSQKDPNYFVDEFVFNKIVNWKNIKEKQILKIKKLIVEIREIKNPEKIQKKEFFSSNRHLKGTKHEFLQFGITIALDSLLRHYKEYSKDKKETISDIICSSINDKVLNKINKNVLSIKEIRNYVDADKRQLVYYFKHPKMVLKKFKKLFCK